MENTKEKIIPIKIIVVGSMEVGKTSLITRYATGNFTQNTQSTKNASYISKIKNEGENTYELKIWDTAGQEKFKALTEIFIKNAQIAILVYSIDNKKSFNDLDDWLNIVKNSNKDFCIGIAANKADLYSESQVSDKEGMDYAEKIGAIWKSTSALSDDNGIDDLVDQLFKKYLQKKQNNEIEEHERGLTLVEAKKSKPKKKGGCCGEKKKNKETQKQTSSNIEKKIGNNNIKDEDF
jgi:small GTP-binding protein